MKQSSMILLHNAIEVHRNHKISDWVSVKEKVTEAHLTFIFSLKWILKHSQVPAKQKKNLHSFELERLSLV